MKRFFRLLSHAAPASEPIPAAPIPSERPYDPQEEPPAPPVPVTLPTLPPEPAPPEEERLEQPDGEGQVEPGLQPEQAPDEPPESPPLRVLSAAEEAEFREFLRTKREAEIALTLRRLVLDLTGECDRFALKAGVERAVLLGAWGVLVPPIAVPAVKKCLAGRGPHILALVGGTGETFPSVKKLEAKRAIRQGAEEVVLAVSAYSLKNGLGQNLRREFRAVRRAARNRTFSVLLADRRLSREEVVFGLKEAAAAGADGAYLSAEAELLEAANETCGLFLGAAGVENAEQLALLYSAGAGRAVTAEAERIADELRLRAERDARGA